MSLMLASAPAPVSSRAPVFEEGTSSARQEVKPVSWRSTNVFATNAGNALSLFGSRKDASLHDPLHEDFAAVKSHDPCAQQQGSETSSSRPSLAAICKEAFQPFIQGYILASPEVEKSDDPDCVLSQLRKELGTKHESRMPSLPDGVGSHGSYASLRDDSVGPGESRSASKSLVSTRRSSSALKRWRRSSTSTYEGTAESDGGRRPSKSSTGEQCTSRGASSYGTPYTSPAPSRAASKSTTCDDTQTVARGTASCISGTRRRSSACESSCDQKGMKSPCKSSEHDDIAIHIRDACLLDLKLEACECLTYVVFGSSKPLGRCGDKELIEKVVRYWTRADKDGSGTWDLEELSECLHRDAPDKLIAAGCLNYFIRKAKLKFSHWRQTEYTLEDIIRLIWLRATDEEVEMMMKLVDEVRLDALRVPAPPALSKRRQQSILDTFLDVDWGKSKTYPWDVLVGSSLIEQSALELMKQRSVHANASELKMEEVLEILCPHGFRAHATATTATTRAGDPVALCASGWFPIVA